MNIIRITAGCLFAALLVPQIVVARPVESKRMERAKDLIADEQWVRAIDELKAAAADAKEANKDEALFWLAHSQNQTHDSAASVETIGRLEREFPASRWVKPARSLRIEIAQRLRRNDVLWYTAAPPPPPPAPAVGPAAPVATTSPFPPAFPVPVPPAAPGVTTPRPPRAPRAAPMPPPPATTIAPAMAPPAPPVPPQVWVPEGFLPDADLRLQALGSLIRTDAVKVIPMLRTIALESGNAGESRRALFYLAQSGRPEARLTVLEVAKTGP